MGTEDSMGAVQFYHLGTKSKGREADWPDFVLQVYSKPMLSQRLFNGVFYRAIEVSVVIDRLVRLLVRPTDRMEHHL